ncbi:hypothetical protein [Bdellovibrio svalbardensis]|uniref:VWFA domain-containing protein n=1 Tax=Bdellovibrio svalbardensis TaxID=2972972 RepID=A0ABT6DIE4_9BACT|nr:hypothetical protein [Bdellovibrio svalbardensis]MDG0815626.1 hypothetical protein [Bdellovibrio svalbardensis]
MAKSYGLGFVALASAMTMMLLGACAQDVKFDLPPTSDNFGQSITYNNKVDILWVMDNSSSMSKHQTNLSQAIPGLMTKLNSLKMDYQMAVVTSSMGGTNPNGGQFIGSPGILNKNTPNLTSVLSSRLVVGQDGSDNERGLESMETVLSSSYQANQGRGFLRSDALLVVIALSDEDDKSKSSASAVSYYTNFLDSIKRPYSDGTRSWMFNFIGILSLSGTCNTTSLDYKEPGLAFMGLSDVSGGTKGSLCNSDMSSAVSEIRARILQILTDFKLSSKPVESTIVVKVNGQVVARNATNGWDYLADKNIIRFYGSAVPAADASIKVDFKPAEAN